MTGMTMLKNRLTASTLALLLGGALMALPQHSWAQDGEAQQEEREQVESLNPIVARDLLTAYELLQEEKFREGLAVLDKLMAERGANMKPFDQASVLQIRGSARVNLDQFKGAISDFKKAYSLKALPAAQNLQLLFNIAQLEFQAENYKEAIRHLEAWLKEADSPDANAYYLLAAAYFYEKNFKAARAPIEKAISLASEPKKQYYDLANIVYAEQSLVSPRINLLERIIENWPADASYWKQLVGLFMEQDRRKEAFVTLEVGYRSGVITDESDIAALAQFYSVFNNPHRGAQMLEKEIADGRVEKNVDNLELLSQLWSQAREHKKAIPVLREAARMSDTGMLSYRLGQTLLADEQNDAAEGALESAINKGGLSDSATPDAWMLLGTARFNQAGPGDKSKRMEADEAFRNAQRYNATRKRAGEWREYIAAINNTEARQAALEAQQRAELAEAARERELSACRAQQISGGEISDTCVELLERQEQEATEATDSGAGEEEAAEDAS